MWDQPQGGSLLHSPRTGNFISQIERRLIFQTWLLAQTPSKPEGIVLAHVGPFSLALWIDVDLANFHPRAATGSIDKPRLAGYGIYAEQGFLPVPVNRAIVGIGPTPVIQAASGNGGRDPKVRCNM
jgi:hypothetical protein